MPIDKSYIKKDKSTTNQNDLRESMIKSGIKPSIADTLILQGDVYSRDKSFGKSDISRPSSFASNSDYIDELDRFNSMTDEDVLKTLNNDAGYAQNISRGLGRMGIDAVDAIWSIADLAATGAAYLYNPDKYSGNGLWSGFAKAYNDGTNALESSIPLHSEFKDAKNSIGNIYEEADGGSIGSGLEGMGTTIGLIAPAVFTGPPGWAKLGAHILAKVGLKGLAKAATVTAAEEAAVLASQAAKQGVIATAKSGLKSGAALLADAYLLPGKVAGLGLGAVTGQATRGGLWVASKLGRGLGAVEAASMVQAGTQFGRSLGQAGISALSEAAMEANEKLQSDLIPTMLRDVVSERLRRNGVSEEDIASIDEYKLYQLATPNEMELVRGVTYDSMGKQMALNTAILTATNMIGGFVIGKIGNKFIPGMQNAAGSTGFFSKINPFGEKAFGTRGLRYAGGKVINELEGTTAKLLEMGKEYVGRTWDEGFEESTQLLITNYTDQYAKDRLKFIHDDLLKGNTQSIESIKSALAEQGDFSGAFGEFAKRVSLGDYLSSESLHAAFTGILHSAILGGAGLGGKPWVGKRYNEIKDYSQQLSDRASAINDKILGTKNAPGLSIFNSMVSGKSNPANPTLVMDMMHNAHAAGNVDNSNVQKDIANSFGLENINDSKTMLALIDASSLGLVNPMIQDLQEFKGLSLDQKKQKLSDTFGTDQKALEGLSDATIDSAIDKQISQLERIEQHTKGKGKYSVDVNQLAEAIAHSYFTNLPDGQLASMTKEQRDTVWETAAKQAQNISTEFFINDVLQHNTAENIGSLAYKIDTILGDYKVNDQGKSLSEEEYKEYFKAISHVDGYNRGEAVNEISLDDIAKEFHSYNEKFNSLMASGTSSALGVLSTRDNVSQTVLGESELNKNQNLLYSSSQIISMFQQFNSGLDAMQRLKSAKYQNAVAMTRYDGQGIVTPGGVFDTYTSLVRSIFKKTRRGSIYNGSELRSFINKTYSDIEEVKILSAINNLNIDRLQTSIQGMTDGTPEKDKAVKELTELQQQQSKISEQLKELNRQMSEEAIAQNYGIRNVELLKDLHAKAKKYYEVKEAVKGFKQYYKDSLDNFIAKKPRTDDEVKNQERRLIGEYNLLLNKYEAAQIEYRKQTDYEKKNLNVFSDQFGLSYETQDGKSRLNDMLEYDLLDSIYDTDASIESEVARIKSTYNNFRLVYRNRAMLNSIANKNLLASLNIAQRPFSSKRQLNNNVSTTLSSLLNYDELEKQVADLGATIVDYVEINGQVYLQTQKDKVISHYKFEALTPAQQVLNIANVTTANLIEVDSVEFLSVKDKDGNILYRYGAVVSENGDKSFIYSSQAKSFKESVVLDNADTIITRAYIINKSTGEVIKIQNPIPFKSDQVSHLYSDLGVLFTDSKKLELGMGHIFIDGDVATIVFENGQMLENIQVDKSGKIIDNRLNTLKNIKALIKATPIPLNNIENEIQDLRTLDNLDLENSPGYRQSLNFSKNIDSFIANITKITYGYNKTIQEYKKEINDQIDKLAKSIPFFKDRNIEIGELINAIRSKFNSYEVIPSQSDLLPLIDSITNVASSISSSNLSEAEALAMEESVQIVLNVVNSIMNNGLLPTNNLWIKLNEINNKLPFPSRIPYSTMRQIEDYFDNNKLHQKTQGDDNTFLNVSNSYLDGYIKSVLLSDLNGLELIYDSFIASTIYKEYKSNKAADLIDRIDSVAAVSNSYYKQIEEMIAGFEKYKESSLLDESPTRRKELELKIKQLQEIIDDIDSLDDKLQDAEQSIQDNVTSSLITGLLKDANVAPTEVDSTYMTYEQLGDAIRANKYDALKKAITILSFKLQNIALSTTNSKNFNGNQIEHKTRVTLNQYYSNLIPASSAPSTISADYIGILKRSFNNVLSGIKDSDRLIEDFYSILDTIVYSPSNPSGATPTQQQVLSLMMSYLGEYNNMTISYSDGIAGSGKTYMNALKAVFELRRAERNGDKTAKVVMIFPNQEILDKTKAIIKSQNVDLSKIEFNVQDAPLGSAINFINNQTDDKASTNTLYIVDESFFLLNFGIVTDILKSGHEKNRFFFSGDTSQASNPDNLYNKFLESFKTGTNVFQINYLPALTFSRRSSNANIKSLLDGLNTESVAPAIEFNRLGILLYDDDDTDATDFFDAMQSDSVITLKGKSNLQYYINPATGKFKSGVFFNPNTSNGTIDKSQHVINNINLIEDTDASIIVYVDLPQGDIDDIFNKVASTYPNLKIYNNSINIQGNEADYVIVDTLKKSNDGRHEFKNLYVILSRAKQGIIITDPINYKISLEGRTGIPESKTVKLAFETKLDAKDTSGASLSIDPLIAGQVERAYIDMVTGNTTSMQATPTPPISSVLKRADIADGIKEIGDLFSTLQASTNIRGNTLFHDELNNRYKDAIAIIDSFEDQFQKDLINNLTDVIDKLINTNAVEHDTATAIIRYDISVDKNGFGGNNYTVNRLKKNIEEDLKDTNSASLPNIKYKTEVTEFVFSNRDELISVTDNNESIRLLNILHRSIAQAISIQDFNTGDLETVIEEEINLIAQASYVLNGKQLFSVTDGIENAIQNTQGLYFYIRSNIASGVSNPTFTYKDPFTFQNAIDEMHSVETMSNAFSKYENEFKSWLSDPINKSLYLAQLKGKVKDIISSELNQDSIIDLDKLNELIKLIQGVDKSIFNKEIADVILSTVYTNDKLIEKFGFLDYDSTVKQFINPSIYKKVIDLIENKDDLLNAIRSGVDPFSIDLKEAFNNKLFKSYFNNKYANSNTSATSDIWLKTMSAYLSNLIPLSDLKALYGNPLTEKEVKQRLNDASILIHGMPLELQTDEELLTSEEEIDNNSSTVTEDDDSPTDDNTPLAIVRKIVETTKQYRKFGENGFKLKYNKVDYNMLAHWSPVHDQEIPRNAVINPDKLFYRLYYTLGSNEPIIMIYYKSENGHYLLSISDNAFPAYTDDVPGWNYIHPNSASSITFKEFNHKIQLDKPYYIYDYDTTFTVSDFNATPEKAFITDDPNFKAEIRKPETDTLLYGVPGDTNRPKGKISLFLTNSVTNKRTNHWIVADRGKVQLFDNGNNTGRIKPKSLFHPAREGRQEHIAIYEAFFKGDYASYKKNMRDQAISYDIAVKVKAFDVNEFLNEDDLKINIFSAGEILYIHKGNKAVRIKTVLGKLDRIDAMYKDPDIEISDFHRNSDLRKYPDPTSGKNTKYDPKDINVFLTYKFNRGNIKLSNIHTDKKTVINLITDILIQKPQNEIKDGKSFALVNTYTLGMYNALTKTNNFIYKNDGGTSIKIPISEQTTNKFVTQADLLSLSEVQFNGVKTLFEASLKEESITQYEVIYTVDKKTEYRDLVDNIRIPKVELINSYIKPVGDNQSIDEAVEVNLGVESLPEFDSSIFYEPVESNNEEQCLNI